MCVLMWKWNGIYMYAPDRGLEQTGSYRKLSHGSKATTLSRCYIPPLQSELIKTFSPDLSVSLPLLLFLLHSSLVIVSPNS